MPSSQDGNWAFPRSRQLAPSRRCASPGLKPKTRWRTRLKPPGKFLFPSWKQLSPLLIVKVPKSASDLGKFASDLIKSGNKVPKSVMDLVKSVKEVLKSGSDLVKSENKVPKPAVKVPFLVSEVAFSGIAQ